MQFHGHFAHELQPDEVINGWSLDSFTGTSPTSCDTTDELIGTIFGGFTGTSPTSCDLEGHNRNLWENVSRALRPRVATILQHRLKGSGRFHGHFAHELRQAAQWRPFAYDYVSRALRPRVATKVNSMDFMTINVSRALRPRVATTCLRTRAISLTVSRALRPRVATKK